MSSRWWDDQSDERYWMEVSDRGADLGVDLNAPLFDEEGNPFWSYDLVDEVEDGDVVIHYDKGARAVVAWSYGVGESWGDVVVWAAQGTSARGKNIQPHERPGRRHALRGPFLLKTPLTLTRLREHQEPLRAIRGDRKYFPFELAGRPTRPMQGYLFKTPLAFVELFPELDEVPRFDGDAGSMAATTETVAVEVTSSTRPEFRPRDEAVRSRRAEPWSRDPSEVDRGLRSHARIERLVAEAARELGWESRGYGKADPVFDLLLERSGRMPIVVVEAKSTTPRNEERQLRLALGQVLRYRQLLSGAGAEVVGMIALEREPADVTWLTLCGEAGVVVAWPETFVARISELT